MTRTKPIDLTDAQFAMLWKVFHGEEIAAEVLGDLIVFMAQRLADEKRLAWEAVRNLIGDESDGRSCKIDWVNRQVYAIKEGDDESQHPQTTDDRSG